MKIKFFVLFIIFISIKLFSFSQDFSKNNTNQPNTIYYQKGLKFTINGKRLRVDDSIENYLNKNTNALYEYHQYKKNEHWSNVFVSIWAVSWIAAITQIGHNNHLALNLGLGGLISLFGGTPFYKKTDKHLKKGIYDYNQQFAW